MAAGEQTARLVSLDFDLATLRIPGVLQRIAVCYLVVWAVWRVALWYLVARALDGRGLYVKV